MLTTLRARIRRLIERARSSRLLSQRLYRAAGLAEQREVDAETDLASAEEELRNLEGEDRQDPAETTTRGG